MKILIQIDQKSSLAAGFDAPHSTEVFNLDPGRVPEELRGWLSECYDLRTGEIYSKVQSILHSWSEDRGDWSAKLTMTLPITEPRVLDALVQLNQEYRAARGRYRAWKLESDAAARAATLAVIAAGPQRYIQHYRLVDGKLQELGWMDTWCHPRESARARVELWRVTWPANWDESVVNSPEGQAVLAECERRNALAMARALADAQAAQTAADAKKIEQAAVAAAAAAARRTQLEGVLERLGTPAQQGRYAAGLLDLEAEALPLLESEVFAPVDALGLGRHTPITEDDVRSLLDTTEYPEPECMEITLTELEPAKTATDDEWELLGKIRAALPGATVTLMVENGWAKNHEDDADLYRNAIRVSITVGAITLERDYASPLGDY